MLAAKVVGPHKSHLHPGHLIFQLMVQSSRVTAKAPNQEHSLLDSLSEVQMCREPLWLQPPELTIEDLLPSII